MKKKELYVGVMSGTSLDGIDTALVEIDDREIKLIAFNDYPIPDDIKTNILNIATGQQTNLIEIGELDTSLGHLYAKAIKKLLIKAKRSTSEITAIGNHGQTVFHQPCGKIPFTIQIGDANIIATETQITTIADFRRKDIALGGQGAPLVPAFHHFLFKPTQASVVILNIGGISNISVLRPNEPTIGYDTGPGNMLLDIWVSKHIGKKFDHNGLYAASGYVIAPLLKQLCSEAYFTQTAPKSTGRELFNLDWLMEKLAQFDTIFAPEDVQATLLEFTAVTISKEVEHYKLGTHSQLLVCGGGANNPILMNRLALLLPNWRVCSTDEKGVNSNYMEAMAFAWLAYRRFHGLPNHLPEVTGATKMASLGVIYPAD